MENTISDDKSREGDVENKESSANSDKLSNKTNDLNTTATPEKTETPDYVKIEEITKSDDVDTKVELKEVEGNIVNFVVIYSKEKYDIKISENSTVLELKRHLENIVGKTDFKLSLLMQTKENVFLESPGVPHCLQKVMFKGLAKNEQTLKQLGVTNSSKVMLVGSKLNDVLNLSAPQSEADKISEEEKTSKEPLCRQKVHRKILDKGIPEDVMPGILNCQESLPPFPISGMVNKAGGKLRITFKLELDELWLGTKERTEKIRMSSIKSIISEPIEGCEHYHIMALQLGPTEASRYWIYYVPAQYVEAIKETVLDS